MLILALATPGEKHDEKSSQGPHLFDLLQGERGGQGTTAAFLPWRCPDVLRFPVAIPQRWAILDGDNGSYAFVGQ